MTSDPTIPPPPPGWAIVPGDDARLDCLPAWPKEIRWIDSVYLKGEKVLQGDRDIYYALPIEPPASPPEQASPAESLPPLAFVTFEDGRSKYIQKASEVHGATLSQVEWVRTPTDEEKYAILPQIRPASPAENDVVIWDTPPASQPWSLPTIDGITWAEQAAEENRQACNNLTTEERSNLLGIAKAIIGTDPKGQAGAAKPPLALLPPEALRQAAWAHASGAAKYGVANWRECKVEAMTYISAMMRHIGQYLDGEDADAESGLNHIAHVIASANILIDAKHCGTLVDNRPPKPHKQRP